MASGGARNRQGRGPAPDPNSLRSAGRGLPDLRPLPAAGFDGDAPEFPLPDATLREVEVWRDAWRSPQAVAWAGEPWRWRSVAMWTRWSVQMENPGASASLGNVVVRLADQIGMTPAGLKENGWQIVADVEPVSDAEAAAARSALTVLDGFGA